MEMGLYLYNTQSCDICRRQLSNAVRVQMSEWIENTFNIEKDVLHPTVAKGWLTCNCSFPCVEQCVQFRFLATDQHRKWQNGASSMCSLNFFSFCLFYLHSLKFFFSLILNHHNLFVSLSPSVITDKYRDSILNCKLFLCRSFCTFFRIFNLFSHFISALLPFIEYQVKKVVMARIYWEEWANCK